ncbi:MAG: hypothetical protein JST51_02870 [Armatimonadetes bacterium]|nr:hypothetical protein [Armatimonadota bacterium]
MRLSVLSAGLLTALAVGAPVQRQRLSLPPELKEAFEHARGLRFSGTRLVTYVKAGRIETHKEFVTKDGPNLKVEFDKASPFAGQIIVETENSRKHYFPDKNEIRVYPSFGKRQFEGFRGAFRSARGGELHIDSSNGGVIAGLHCTKYQLSDKDNNPVVQIYIEPRSGMLTKRVLYDQTGNIAGSYEFVSLTLNPRIQPGTFEIRRRGATVVRPIDELRKQGKDADMPVLTLRESSGYRLESVYSRVIKGSKVIVQNFGTDDSRLTLFMTRSTLNPADLKKMERGELSSYVWTLDGVTLVLIGDQPEERLRSLASQVAD